MWKKLFLLVMFVSCMYPLSAFGENEICKTDVPLNNELVHFSAGSYTHKIDYRCHPTMVIEVSVDKAKLLKDGKAIYFTTTGDFIFDIRGAKVTEGNAKVKLSHDLDTNIIRLEFNTKNMKSYDLKKPLTVRIETYPYIDRRIDSSLNDLRLITGTQFEDNLFFNEKEEQVLLNDSFLKIIEPLDNHTIDTEQNNVLSISVGKDTMEMNGKIIPLETPSYINKDGYTMFPVSAITEALNNTAVVRWDKEMGICTISSHVIVFSMEKDSNIMTKNGYKVDLMTAPEVKENQMYLPLRDLIHALNIPDNQINWDEHNSTIIINF